jgi:hypothetical protein
MVYILFSIVHNYPKNTLIIRKVMYITTTTATIIRTIESMSTVRAEHLT